MVKEAVVYKLFNSTTHDNINSKCRAVKDIKIEAIYTINKANISQTHPRMNSTLKKLQETIKQDTEHITKSGKTRYIKEMPNIHRCPTTERIQTSTYTLYGRFCKRGPAEKLKEILAMCKKRETKLIEDSNSLM
jgi:hypothetical protein